MTYTFIINPRAGSGRLRRRQRQLLEAIRQSGMDHQFRFTERPKHATEIARRAAESSDVVVAVGGDGTVHEVAAGLIAADRSAHLAVIPAGSGNDFAKMFDIPRTVDQVVEALRDGRPRSVDYGRVHWDDPEGGGTGTFVNVAGTGIDAKVAAAAARFKYLSGTPRYAAAVLQTLRHWNAPEATIEIHSGSAPAHIISSDVLLVIAANGKCAAGGFYLAPQAAVDDGMLDACVITDATLLRILALIPRVLRGGRHVGQPEVTVQKADEIVVRPASPQAVQADGEILTTAATRVSFKVVAGGLSVLMPVKS